ncbi:hypothetical protein LMG28727_03213 [Paraburkholderia kirstenboschensis]|nr:hypothetical protein LMG28727_03213 [Paraburkholderia kirstenboschensis]
MRYVRSITQLDAAHLGFGKAGNMPSCGARHATNLPKEIGKRYAGCVGGIGKGGLAERNASGTSFPHS